MRNRRSPLESFRSHLQARLSPERYQHSVNVSETLAKAASIYGLKPRKAAMAGLLHDILKEADNAYMMDMLARHAPQDLDHIGDCICSVYLHGPAGACLLEHEFGFTDPEVLEAIRYHAGDYVEAGLLTRCLSVADMTAPTMAYPGMKKLKRLFVSGHLNEAELLLTHWAMETHVRIGVPNHPFYKIRFQMLMAQLSPGPNFFSREE